LKNRSAFTMIELVFVIVVLGILASLAMERMDRDLKQEAAETILSHIRLTQQLALRDNKHRSDNNAQWQKAYWKIQFRNCSTSGEVMPIYSVGSDRDLSGDISKIESAIDPINGKYLYATCLSSSLTNDVSKDIRIGKKFGIKQMAITGCGIVQGTSSAKQIAFDYLGRPHRGITSTNVSLFNKKVRTDCILKFDLLTDQDNDGVDDSFTIKIEAETGHAYIVGQEAL